MKQKKIELDVDFIGGQGALTAEEEKALNDFFKQRKLISCKLQIDKKPRSVKRSKSTV